MTVHEATALAAAADSLLLLWPVCRYCEQQDTDPARTGPAVAFARIALSLALLPCSDYLFHADGDALFFNQEATLDPLIEQMEKHDVDLLATADIIKESPINFGVYMVRGLAASAGLMLSHDMIMQQVKPLLNAMLHVSHATANCMQSAVWVGHSAATS